MTDTDYAYDLALLTNTPAPAESLVHSLEQAAEDIGSFVDANKTEYMRFKQNKKRGHLHTEWQASKISGPVHIPQQQ